MSKIPPELLAAVGCRSCKVQTSIWDDGDACCVVTHLACGKEHCTRIYRKRETAERNAERWTEKHLATCRKTVEADAAFAASQEGVKP